MADREPLKGRPRGAAWRALQDEGVVWEGSVALTLDGVRVALLLVATQQRLVLVRGGEVTLEIPRGWLRPGPVLDDDGSVTMSVDAEGTGRPDAIRLVVHDGRPAAAHLVSLLAGSGVRPVRPARRALPVYVPEPLPDTPPPPMARSRQSFRPVSLEETAAPMAVGQGRSGRDDAERLADLPSLAMLDPDDFPPLAPGERRPFVPSDTRLSAAAMRDEPPTIPASLPPEANGRDHDWNLQPLQTMSMRSARHARRGMVIRLSGLIALLAFAAAFGAGRLPGTPRFPEGSHIPGTSINAPFTDGGSKAAPTRPAAVAQVGTTPTPPPTIAATRVGGVPTLPAQERIEPTLMAERTAIAFGVGGPADLTPTAPEPPPTSVPPTPMPTVTATATTATTVATVPTEAPTEPVLPADVAATVTPSPTVTAAAEPSSTSTPETVPTPIPTDEPAPTTAPVATDEPTSTVAPVATDEPPSPTAAATEVPAATPAPTATPEATVEPTAKATATEPSSPTGTPTPAATDAPTGTPTPAATASPTPTATAAPSPTAKATKAPTVAATPGFPVQAPSLGAGELPAQTFGYAAMRFTVEAALRAPAIDALQLQALGYGDWVVVVLNVENWSDASASVPMRDLKLFASGSAGPQYVAADPTSGAIAASLGLSPATGPTETLTLDPGASQRVALLYVVAPDSTVVELMAGQRAVDLAEAFGRAVDITDLGPAAPAPKLVEAIVTRVIDGRTIEVAVAGVTTKVRYIGVAAPIGDACYAAESTAANSALVQGQTVWLERERKNSAGKATLLRDVWVADGAGGRTLAAAALAAQGAVTVETVDPEIRYAGWITAAAGTAQFNGLGLWGACAAGQPAAAASSGGGQTTNASTDPSGGQPPIQPAAWVGGTRLG